MNRIKKTGLMIAIAATSLTSPFAAAGFTSGTVTYGPVSSSIPTLSGSLLIVLALLLAAVALRLLHQRSHKSARLMIWLAATGALSLGAGGVKLVSEAQARQTPIALDNPAGGEASSPYALNDSRFQNDTSPGVTLRILQITPNSANDCVVSPATGTPECTTATVLAPGESCVVFFDCSPM